MTNDLEFTGKIALTVDIAPSSLHPCGGGIEGGGSARRHSPKFTLIPGPSPVKGGREKCHIREFL